MKRLLRDGEVESVIKNGQRIRLTFTNGEEKETQHAKAIEDELLVLQEAEADEEEVAIGALSEALTHLRAIATDRGIGFEHVSAEADRKALELGMYGKGFLAHGSPDMVRRVRPTDAQQGEPIAPQPA